MKKSNYIEISNIVQVIGCIFKEPTLFEKEEYTFHKEDFYDKFHQIVFGTIYNLWHLGAKEITLPAIEDYLEQRPKSHAIYKQNNGQEFLEKAKGIANLQTFDYYYNRMKKMSLLRAYEDLGFDLSWLYNPDELKNLKKKQEQEDWLDNATIQEIYDKINGKIDKIKERYVDEIADEGVQASAGVRELIHSFETTPAVGYPLADKFITTTARGARPGTFFLRSAPVNLGKAIPNDTLIPTPDGWRKVGDIQVGDYLFDEQGQPTKVLQIHPQAEPKQIWEVEFLDGRVAQCCEEHLWEYAIKKRGGGYTYKVANTKTLYDKGQEMGFQSSDKLYRFRVRLSQPVNYSEKEYSVPPYVMGALLGDGSFRYNKTNKALTFSSENEELPNLICSYLGEGYYSYKNSDYNYNYSFKHQKKGNHNIWVEELLKDYPELWNVKSQDKFIPEEYLLGSIQQRYELLAGLLDTDGSIGKKTASVTYYTISEKLRDNVIELAQSLGMVVTVKEDRHKETNVCYMITLQCHNSIKPQLFKLSRKKEVADFHANKKQKYYKDKIAIVNIRPTEKYADMTCFTVDNPNHLFLMNDYIVTHNTRSMIEDSCNFGCNEYFDIYTNEWKFTGDAQPTLLIATEQQLDEIQTMIIAHLAGVEEDHIVMHEYGANEWERVDKAITILENSPLYFVCMPDFTTKEIETIVKKYIREKQVTYVVFDYIHSSASILSEIGNGTGVKGLREDNILFLLSSALKDIAVKYGVFVLSSTQLNMDYKTSDTPDQNLLRGAKSIADRIDWGGIMLPVTNEDIEKLKGFCENNGIPIPNLKLSVYKNRANRWKNIYLWMRAETGVCSFRTFFVTDWNFNVIDMPLLDIQVKEENAW